MKYGETLKKALAITWKYKILWLVGVVIVLFGAGFSGPPSMPQWTSSVDEAPDFVLTYGAEIFSYIQTIAAPLVIVGILFGLVMALVSIVVNFTGQGMLINMVDGISNEQEPVFKDALNKGWKNFWKLFLIQLLVNIAVLIVILIELFVLGILAAIIIGIFLLLDSVATALGLLWIIPLGFVWIVLILGVFIATGGLAEIIVQLAYRETILNDLGITQALGAAWNTFISKTGPSAGSWGMQLLLGLVVGIVESILAFAFGALFILGTFLWISTSITESIGLAIVIAIPIVLLLSLITLFINTLYQVAKSSMWTLFFRQIEGLSAETTLEQPAALPE